MNSFSSESRIAVLSSLVLLLFRLVLRTRGVGAAGPPTWVGDRSGGLLLTPVACHASAGALRVVGWGCARRRVGGMRSARAALVGGGDSGWRAHLRGGGQVDVARALPCSLGGPAQHGMRGGHRLLCRGQGELMSLGRRVYVPFVCGQGGRVFVRRDWVAPRLGGCEGPAL